MPDGQHHPQQHAGWPKNYGKYSFLLPDMGEGGCRELRDPDAEDDEIPD